MVKVTIGLVLGVIVGVAAVLVFSAMGGSSRPAAALAAPGQAVIHISADQSYINQKITSAMSGQDQFRNVRPVLTLQTPNSVIVAADLQADIKGTIFKASTVITMQLYADAGRIRTRILSVDLGTLKIPLDPFQAQIDQIERIMGDETNRAVAVALKDTGLKIVNVSTTNTSLVVDMGE